MIGQSEWGNKMASSRFIMPFFLLLVIAHRASSLNCGWPGQPNGGIIISSSLPMPVAQDAFSSRGFIPSNRLLSYQYLFQEGQVVAYQCHNERRDFIKGTSVNRTCKSDGRWSGTRPWCDLNVAFGKTVTYSGISNSMSDTLMTDGLIDSTDPMNGAICATLGKSNAYFSVNLEEDLPVRVVGVFGKPGDGINNLEVKKVILGSSNNCPQKQGNSSAFGYECSREQSTVSSSDPRGNTVRFEHGSSFSVDICEVVVYANPTLADCGEPEIPAFGEVAISTATTYQEAKYYCRNGYELQGLDVRRCNGRNWDGDQPICVEMLTSPTTEINRNTTDPVNLAGGGNSGGLDPFQIVLIVVCVALAIGLIVALIVLLKFGRLSCCGSYGSTLSKKTGTKKKPTDQRDYQKVTTTPITNTPATSSTEEADKRAAALAAAEREREEQDFVNTRLAYQNERAQQSQPKTTAPTAKTITYAELIHEPRKRVPDSPMGHSLSDLSIEPASPIYAQVHMRSSKTADDRNGGINTGSSEQTATPPVRKSYIPSIYLKESPEVQLKQQALNDQLKQAVRISRNTDF